MDAFDFSLLQNDLQELEEKLQQYGSKPVKDEISLNQLFIDHLASGGSRTRAVLALAAGHSQSLDKSARLSIAASIELLQTRIRPVAGRPLCGPSPENPQRFASVMI
jgi:hypothetical protein